MRIALTFGLVFVVSCEPIWRWVEEEKAPAADVGESPAANAGEAALPGRSNDAAMYWMTKMNHRLTEEAKKPDFPYFAKGELCAPENVITTKEECSTAAKRLISRFSLEDEDSPYPIPASNWFPKGCAFSLSFYYFNTPPNGGNGRKTGWVMQICKKPL